MTNKRKMQDFMANLATYLSMAISIVILGAILVYVFSTGLKRFSFDMLSNDYWSTNYKSTLTEPERGSFTRPEGLSDESYFSTSFGIALEDTVNNENAEQVIIVYMDDNSPFKTAVNAVAGETFNQPVTILNQSVVQRIVYQNQNGSFSSISKSESVNAKDFVSSLDSSAISINSIQYQTSGGGMRGSLVATLMLIGLTLLFALPVGIFAAIYLHELAPHNRWTNLIRSSIEMLAGVPSIIFGLMGVAVLFPITTGFGATTVSILLGSMTLAVMLLPIIIRSTEEALIVVPSGYRDGSLSLGATQTQTIFKVVIPSALPGILSAILLSISRIIGESAALIFAMGTYIMDNPTIMNNATSLAVQIWTVMSGENPNFELACAISIVILVMVLALNLSIKIISNRLTKKWSV